MIKRLKITDFRLLKEVDFNPGFGLNVITGETGAGKSMLISALSTLLGKRTGADAVRKGADRARIEAEFELKGANSSFKLVREIDRKGKSRFSNNGENTTASAIRKFSMKIIDLHGQHEHQSLLDPNRHVDFIDLRGELNEVRDSVKSKFLETKAANDRLDLLNEKKRIAEEKRELLEFRMKELSEADPKQGETDTIEREIMLLENGEKLANKSREIADRLYERESSLYEQLESIRSEMEELSGIDAKLSEQASELSGASITLRELAGFLSSYSEKVELDPAHLEQLRERHSLLLSLARKYGGSESAMLNEYEATLKEFDSFESVEESITEAEKRSETLRKQLASQALGLSEKRRAASLRLSEDVIKSMKGLGIEKPEFEVRFERAESPNGWVRQKGKRYFVTEEGLDRVEFYISTNPGEDLKPLAQVASGGEISRIMLAIKAILADRGGIPVLVFDEIDIGISGRIAEAVGRRLKEISKFHQVICITHLPQIAGKADHHFLVEKEIVGNRTLSTVKELNPSERKEAVASLLAGSEITESARRQAEEMLN